MRPEGRFRAGINEHQNGKISKLERPLGFLERMLWFLCFVSPVVNELTLCIRTSLHLITNLSSAE